MKTAKREQASAEEVAAQPRKRISVDIPVVMFEQLKARAKTEGRLLYVVVESVLAKGLTGK